VIVVRVLVQGLPEVLEGHLGISRIERHRRRIDPFFRGSRDSGRLACGLTLADPEVETGPLEQLALVLVPGNHRAELLGRRGELVTLEQSDGPLI
jgi:hypothetical protein